MAPPTPSSYSCSCRLSGEDRIAAGGLLPSIDNRLAPDVYFELPLCGILEGLFGFRQGADFYCLGVDPARVLCTQRGAVTTRPIREDAVVGCGYQKAKQLVFFTLNGRILGERRGVT